MYPPTSNHYTVLSPMFNCLNITTSLTLHPHPTPQATQMNQDTLMLSLKHTFAPPPQATQMDQDTLMLSLKHTFEHYSLWQNGVNKEALDKIRFQKIMRDIQIVSEKPVRAGARSRGGDVAPFAVVGCRFRSWGCRFRSWGCRFRSWGCRFRSWGCRFRSWGCRFRSWGCRFRSWGCRFRSWGCSVAGL